MHPPPQRLLHTVLHLYLLLLLLQRTAVLQQNVGAQIRGAQILRVAQVPLLPDGTYPSAHAGTVEQVPWYEHDRTANCGTAQFAGALPLLIEQAPSVADAFPVAGDSKYSISFDPPREAAEAVERPKSLSTRIRVTAA